MYQSELFLNGKSALEKCLGVRQVFNFLPANVEISIQLDNRIPCALFLRDDQIILEPRAAHNADLELVLFSESIRRLSNDSSLDFTALIKALASLSLTGQVRGKLLCSPQDLYSKGYLHALKGLGPELQTELAKYAFILLSKANSLADTFKSILKR